MAEEHETELFLYRGLNSTSPSSFRIDADGLSVYEQPLEGYRYNMKFHAMVAGEKISGVTARLIETQLSGGIAVFTPEFGEGHWSIRFPDLTASEAKILLSKFAKSVLK